MEVFQLLKEDWNWIAIEEKLNQEKQYGSREVQGIDEHNILY